MARIQGYSEDDVDLLIADYAQVVLASVLRSTTRIAGDIDPTRSDGLAASSSSLTPNDLMQFSEYWTEEVDGTLVPYVAEVWSGSATQLAAALGSEFVDDVEPGVPLVPHDLGLEYLKTVKNHLTGVSDEVWEDLRNELLTGVEQGLPTPQIAARLQAVGNLKLSDATRIARTHIHTAAEAGSIAELRYVGYTSEDATKEWLTVHDARVRPTHVAADHQTVPLDDKFVVGGTMMDHPGDYLAPASEKDNCRCTVVFNIDEAPKVRCNGMTAATGDPVECVTPVTHASVDHLTNGEQQVVWQQFTHAGITPAYGGAKILKVVDELLAKLQTTHPDLAAKLDRDMVLTIVDKNYVAKKETFGQKYYAWSHTPAGKKALGAAPAQPKILAVKAPVVTVTPEPAAPSKPKLLHEPSGKFKILGNPGKSGDGSAPGGQWGKYGSSGVLIESIGDDGVRRYLLIQRGEHYIGSQQLKWQLPGGGLDQLETPYEAAARELWEETGATKEYVESMIPTGEMIYDGGYGWKYTTITARAKETFVPDVSGSGSTGDAKWFTADEIRAMLKNGDIVKELSPTLGGIVDEMQDVPAVLSTKFTVKPDLPPVVGAPDPADLTFTGKTLGSHGAQVWVDQQGRRWLFKPQQDWMTDLDVAIAKLQSKAQQTRPGIYKYKLNGKSGSLQYMFESKAAFPTGDFDPLTLSGADLAVFQHEQIFDWMISNFDTHTGQFIRLDTGALYGTDKGQAFKFFGKDKLDWTYVPVYPLSPDKLTYSALWKAFVEGKNVALTDPTKGELGEFIDQLMAIPDHVYRALLRPYGKFRESIGLGNSSQFLDAAVARKNHLRQDFEEFWARAVAEREKKVGPMSPPVLPVPEPAVAKIPVPTPEAAAVAAPTSAAAGGTAQYVKDTVWDAWLEVSGAKKVTPAYGGAKIFKLLQEVRQSEIVKGIDVSSLSDAKLLEILDEMGGFQGKPKTYTNVMTEWSKTPAGKKALGAPIVEPTPVPTATPSPSGTGPFGSKLVGDNVTFDEIVDAVPKFHDGDVIATGSLHTTATDYRLVSNGNGGVRLYYRNWKATKGQWKLLQSTNNAKLLKLENGIEWQAGDTFDYGKLGTTFGPVAKPVVSVGTTIPDAAAGAVATGQKVTFDKLLSKLEGYADGDDVAYFTKDATGKKYKVTKYGSGVKLYGQTGDGKWTYDGFIEQQMDAVMFHDISQLHDQWTMATPKATAKVASKIPGKGPGDSVTLDEIIQSKWLWKDGETIAEGASGKVDYKLVSDGSAGGSLYVSQSGGFEGEWLFVSQYPNLQELNTELVSIKTASWKLGVDTLDQKLSGAIPTYNAGDVIDGIASMQQGLKNLGAAKLPVAYAYKENIGVEYRLISTPHGMEIQQRLAGSSNVWSQPTEVQSGKFLQSMTWRVAKANGDAPLEHTSLFKISTPAGPATKKVPWAAYGPGKQHLDDVTVDEVLLAAVDGSNPDWVEIATGTSPGGTSQYRLYWSDDKHLMVDVKVNGGGVSASHGWQFLKMIDSQADMPKGVKWKVGGYTKIPKTSVAAKAAKAKAKTFSSHLVKSNTVSELTEPVPKVKSNSIVGINPGDVVSKDDLIPFADSYDDGVIIAYGEVKSPYYKTEKYRIFKVDGVIIYQKQSKAGTWISSEGVTNKWSIPGHITWKLAKPGEVITKPNMTAAKKFAAKFKEKYAPSTHKVSSKASSSYGPSPVPTEPPAVPFEMAHVDLTPWNDAEQLEVYTIFRSTNVYTSASPESIWSQIQSVKYQLQNKYGGKYTKLNEIEILRIVDLQRAKKKGIVDTHPYEAKIVNWLKTPGGKAYINKKIDAPLATVEIPEPMSDFTASAVDMADQKYVTVTQAEAKAYREESHAKYGGWTPAQKSALREYTGGVYTSWNNAIRTGDISKYRAKILAEQAAMRPSTRPMLLHRGTTFAELNDPSISSYETLLAHVGQTYINRGYMSASVGGKAAFGGWGSNALIIEVEAPIGTPMSYVADFSQHPGERETTLATHLVFRILKVTKDKNGATVMRVRVIGAAQP